MSSLLLTLPVIAAKVSALKWDSPYMFHIILHFFTVIFTYIFFHVIIITIFTIIFTIIFLNIIFFTIILYRWFSVSFLLQIIISLAHHLCAICSSPKIWSHLSHLNCHFVSVFTLRHTLIVQTYIVNNVFQLA